MNAGDEGVVTCTLPSQALAVGDTADCTVSVLDQRDWGGCVDVQMVSAAAILPPSPPPAPLVSNAGVYKLTKDTVIDNSAATFTCCALEAELNVPEYELGLAASFTATLSGKANGCTTTALRPLLFQSLTLSRMLSCHTFSLTMSHEAHPPLGICPPMSVGYHHPKTAKSHIHWSCRRPRRVPPYTLVISPNQVPHAITTSYLPNQQRHGYRDASALEHRDGRQRHA